MNDAGSDEYFFWIFEEILRGGYGSRASYKRQKAHPNEQETPEEHAQRVRQEAEMLEKAQAQREAEAKRAREAAQKAKEKGELPIFPSVCNRSILIDHSRHFTQRPNKLPLVVKRRKLPPSLQSQLRKFKPPNSLRNVSPFFNTNDLPSSPLRDTSISRLSSTESTN